MDLKPQPKPMPDTPTAVLLQDHAAFVAGNHDFQGDIEIMANSDTIRVILETVMLATGMRWAAVARVTKDRWVACRTADDLAFGMAEGDEIAIDQTFCNSVRQNGEWILFDDASKNPLYADHPITRQFGIVSYLSVPVLRADGAFFGTLCALDTVPRKIEGPRAKAMLAMFADIVGRILDTEERLAAQEANVAHEQQLARVQEEFLAILGHDLKNPLAALTAATRQLGNEDLSERGTRIRQMMWSALRRVDDLVENMMYHARSRLGGIRVTAQPNAPLADAVRQVAEEIRAAEPDHDISVDVDIPGPVSCDAPRIAQAVSNLLSNAIRHGAEGGPIGLSAKRTGDEIVIAVTNRGDPIPAEIRSDLFEPFRRGSHARGEGLGLGLYIASAIATAHNGRIEVSHKGGETTVCLRMPMLAAA